MIFNFFLPLLLSNRFRYKPKPQNNSEELKKVGELIEEAAKIPVVTVDVSIEQINIKSHRDFDLVKGWIDIIDYYDTKMIVHHRETNENFTIIAFEEDRERIKKYPPYIMDFIASKMPDHLKPADKFRVVLKNVDSP